MPTITGRYALGTAQYHCPVCNVYFASSTAAIRAHENGKKHLEKVREARDAKRERRKEEEKVRREIEKEIKGIDEAVKRGMEEGFYEAKGPGVGSEGLKEWKKKREEEVRTRGELHRRKNKNKTKAHPAPTTPHHPHSLTHSLTHSLKLNTNTTLTRGQRRRRSVLSLGSPVPLLRVPLRGRPTAPPSPPSAAPPSPPKRTRGGTR